MGKYRTNTRNVVWTTYLLLMALACAVWSSLPTLESSPFVRVALFSSAGLVMLGLVFSFPDISDRSARRLIIAAAVLLRLILWPAPVSDDVNRYVWEGRLVLHGENPYIATADDPRWEVYQDDVWAAMNHRNLPTAYPPGIQWVMAGTTAVWENTQAFKVLALAGDMATLFLLLALFRRQRAPLRWAGFYAFNPVVLIAFAAEAHFDSLMTAALLATLLAAVKDKRSAWWWLGVAIQLKLICIILAPLFLTRRLWKGAGLLLPVLVLPTLPFLAGFSEWGSGVGLFALRGSFNAPLYSLMDLCGIEHARLLAMLVFAISAGIIVIRRWRGMDMIEASLWILASLLVCSPIVHFWYLTWLLPLVALRPSFAWTTASITMGAYFIAWWTEENAGWWGFGHGIAAVIWIPWLVAWLLQHRVGFPRVLATDSAAGSTLPSVVVPVLNPGHGLALLVTELKSDSDPEIIVADGGSDGEMEQTGVRVIHAPRGRGNQIAAGIAAANSPWILIAHADIRPRAGWSGDLADAIERHPNASLFVFGQRFDTGGPGTLLIEILNEMRAVFTGISFGDQTMVVRRSALEACGGFPIQPLMEDVEVCLRLARCGPAVYIGREWLVSARKWNVGGRTGFFSRVWMIVRLVAGYRIARLRGPAHAAVAAERMYRHYYADGHIHLTNNIGRPVHTLKKTPAEPGEYP